MAEAKKTDIIIAHGHRQPSAVRRQTKNWKSYGCRHQAFKVSPKSSILEPEAIEKVNPQQVTAEDEFEAAVENEREQ